MEIGKEIPCHRNVLAACSEYFRAMFCNGHRESKEPKVTIHEVSPGALQLLVDYAYTSKVTITQDNAVKLLEGANFFQILPVRDACVSFISNNLSAKDCLQMMHIGNILSCPDLENRARSYALKDFATLSKAPEFLSSTKGQLVTLISSDDLNASEEVVYTAVTSWINHDTDGRNEDMKELMELVRFPFMDKQYFLENVESNEAVRKSCQDVMTEARRCQHFPREIESPRTRPCHASGLREAVVVIGGLLEHENLNKSKSFTMTCNANPNPVEVYDRRQNKWTEGVPLPQPKIQHAVAVLDSSIYVMGGYNDKDERTATMDRFSPGDSQWQSMRDMPGVAVADCGAIATVLNGLIYLAGLQSSLYCYTPSEDGGLWSEVVSLSGVREDCGMTVFKGKVYFFGGYDDTTGSLFAASSMVSPIFTFPPNPVHLPTPNPSFFIPSSTCCCFLMKTKVKTLRDRCALCFTCLQMAR
uniref:BTB domain-containing protein n=1 Tax=Branchiostoma floridae TaxID=7739 RepID=C3YL29_BRAFL|eukprot:XP_002603008.1 hypothetical protein BRAFLDRAFT_84743 [Branchiostoma floridae]